MGGHNKTGTVAMGSRGSQLPDHVLVTCAGLRCLFHEPQCVPWSLKGGECTRFPLNGEQIPKDSPIGGKQ